MLKNNCQSCQNKKAINLPTCFNDFGNGLIVTNPIFILALGLCPAMAVTVGIDRAIAYSCGLAFVLFSTSIAVSGIRKVVPEIVRIPVFIVIVATFVTVVDLTFEAYLPDMWHLLGIYLPLLTVNCVVMGRAEVFASKQPMLRSIFDAMGIALGFTLAILLITIPREILGTGSLHWFQNSLFSIPILSQTPITAMVLPPGAFLIMGVIYGLLQFLGVVKNVK